MPMSSSTYSPTPELYSRYTVDCFSTSCLSPKELNTFISFIGSLSCLISPSPIHLFVSLTSPSASTTLTLTISVFYKLTDIYSYLNFSFSHPIYTECSFSVQFLQLLDFCNNNYNFEMQVWHMVHFFNRPGYSSSLIHSAFFYVCCWLDLSFASRIPPPHLLSPTTFHPPFVHFIINFCSSSIYFFINFAAAASPMVLLFLHPVLSQIPSAPIFAPSFITLLTLLDPIIALCTLGYIFSKLTYIHFLYVFSTILPTLYKTSADILQVSKVLQRYPTWQRDCLLTCISYVTSTDFSPVLM